MRGYRISFCIVVVVTLVLWPTVSTQVQASGLPTVSIKTALLHGGTGLFAISADLNGFTPSPSYSNNIKFSVGFLDDQGQVGLGFVPGIALPAGQPSTVVIWNYSWKPDLNRLVIIGRFTAFTPTSLLLGVQSTSHEEGNFTQALPTVW